MRRLIPLIVVALAVSAATPASAVAGDTKVIRHDEAVGSLVHDRASRYKVEDINYDVEAEVRRRGKRRFEFFGRNGMFGWAVKATGRRWDVYSAAHPEDRVGYVDRIGRREYGAYLNDGERIGSAYGQAAVQGAASVFLVFHH